MKKGRLLPFLMLCMAVIVISNKGKALSDSELYELFQQGGSTGNLVSAEEVNFFGHAFTEIGIDIDVVAEIMHQNGLDVTRNENNLTEEHQSISAYGINPGAGIYVLVNHITNNFKFSDGNHPGEYIVGDTVSYRYDLGVHSHDAYIGIRNICMGDSLADFLEKLGFSNATILASTINYVVDAEYENEWEARRLLDGIIYAQEGVHLCVENKKITEINNNSEIDGNTRFQIDFTGFSLSLGEDLRCSFEFENNRLDICTITLLVRSTQNNSLPPDASNPTILLPIEKLATVVDTAMAIEAVSYLTGTMTSAQKTAPTCIDLATLYAETASAKAATKPAASDSILINAATVADIEPTAVEASEAVEAALTDGGVTTARYLSKTVILTTDEQDISVQIDPDILTTEVDKVRVETPTYAVTFKLSDLEPDLTQPLTFTAQDIGTGYAAGSNSGKTTVKIGLPNGRTTNSITVSLPSDGGDTTYQTVISTDGQATASKYNPATTTMDGKINTSGTYTVKSNGKYFTDIADKSAEMQTAIRYLASKGIINGTTATTFSPDGSINRAEIATLLVKALGKLDSTATASFSDVTKGNWFYTAAASSQRHKLINGYEDNTFRGTTNISKVQIVAVSSRVLKTEMGYKEPASPVAYLSKYSDAIASWAQSEVALATKENLVVYRTDGTFSGDKNMTRGDAAIIIYRLFQRIW